MKYLLYIYDFMNYTLEAFILQLWFFYDGWFGTDGQWQFISFNVLQFDWTPMPGHNIRFLPDRQGCQKGFLLP